MLYIIRHGRTDWNDQRKLQGKTDVPLNDTGRRMAKEAAIRYADVHFDICFTSPLQRAVETAEILLAGRNVPIIKDDRLIEMSFGIYEGMENGFDDASLPVHELFTDPGYDKRAEGGESFGELFRRTGEFLKEIQNLNGNILVSTHAIAMKGLLENLTPDSKGSYWAKHIGNCAVYVTENKNGNFSIPVEI